ncbi:FAD-dependent oxidoreductase [Nocardia callitridis]
METTDVVIAGAGPTGLMLAYELRTAGIRVTLLDRLPGRTGESRAGGIHARTMEVLDQRGLLDRIHERGNPLPAGHFGGLRMDFSDLATRRPYALTVLQSVLEAELESSVTELGVDVAWSSPVVAVEQDTDGVEVTVEQPHGTRRIRAAYLVGCDGGRSTVRKLVGIGFDGTDATMTGMLADVELADPPTDRIFAQRNGPGDFSAIQFQPGWYRLLVQRHDLVLDRNTELTFAAFRDHFTEVAGTDFGMHSPRWVSHFGDAARQADRYREGRVFLAGDAAHIHFPAGGQGLNLGVQDAVNLGWKLAAALRADAADALLESYAAERYPVATRVLHNTRAQTALMRPGVHTDALRDTMRELLEVDQVRHHLGLMVTALDIRYPTESEHPLAGRRVPDADLSTDEGDTTVHALLRHARPVLLVLGDTDAPSVRGWTDRLDVRHAETETEHWTIPDLGDIPQPRAVLIRPDGYVAWATNDEVTTDLTDLLTRWFGPAATAVRDRAIA